MVMTILEGKVVQENWDMLKKSYSELARQMDPGVERSYLVQNTKNPGVWRIMTLWTSMEALEKMRSRPETPGGVVVFRQAECEPVLEVFEVALELGVNIHPDRFEKGDHPAHT